MQAYPYIVQIHCFIIHFTLFHVLNFNPEMLCAMNFFVSNYEGWKFIQQNIALYLWNSVDCNLIDA